MNKKLIYNRLNHLAIGLVVMITALTQLIGCSQAYYNPSSYAADDMYSYHNRDQMIQQQQAQAIAQAQVEEQRKAYWAQELGMTTQPTGSYSQPQATVEYYDSPYSEKLSALSMSSGYERPSSYYDLQYDDATLETLAKYDPSEYDAYVDANGTVVVEPKYVSSMYGTWGDYDNYAWRYGYTSPYYYSVWGYPRYSWWDYNYYYNYGWGLGFGYRPYYYNWYRPSYRPNYRPSHRPSHRPSYRPSNTITRRPSQSRPSSAVTRSSGGRTNGNTYYRRSSNQSQNNSRGNSSYNSGSRNNNTRSNSSRSNNTRVQSSSPTRSTQSSFGGGGGGSSRPSSSGGGGGGNRIGR